MKTNDIKIIVRVNTVRIKLYFFLLSLSIRKLSRVIGKYRPNKTKIRYKQQIKALRIMCRERGAT